MSYDFSFDKKTISLLLGGFVFVGATLFIGGLLLGANWRAELPATASSSGGQTVASPTPEPPPVPKEPVLRADATRPVAAAEPSIEPTPAEQAHNSSAGVNSRRPSAPQPIPDDEVKIISRADASPAEDDEPNQVDQQMFSVQVGVFFDKNNANELVRQLQAKGYTPIVLTATDDENRLWYAVRIGAYTNKTEAMQAGSNITKQEKLQTIVRPLGSL